VIEAYFDESERNDGTFCVAAYCYFPAKARKMEKKWRQIMEGRTFHASDMNCKEGEFKSLDKESSDRMYRSLIDSILKYAELGIVASVNPREVAAKWPEHDGFRTPYGLCCYFVVARISSYLDSKGIKSPVSFIFEAGHKHQSETERLMSEITMSESRKAYFHYLSHCFASKTETLLQTADLLAWEWGKEMSESRGRASLNALLLKGADRHIIGHLSGDVLEKEFAYIEEILRSVRSEPG
jgi:hypothetical protein